MIKFVENREVYDFWRGFRCVLFFALLSGCSLFEKRVANYDRQVLSLPQMTFIPHPILEVHAQHTFNAREGSVGGFGGAGGGCGCN